MWVFARRDAILGPGWPDMSLLLSRSSVDRGAPESGHKAQQSLRLAPQCKSIGGTLTCPRLMGKVDPRVSAPAQLLSPASVVKAVPALQQQPQLFWRFERRSQEFPITALMPTLT